MGVGGGGEEQGSPHHAKGENGSQTPELSPLPLTILPALELKGEDGLVGSSGKQRLHSRRVGWSRPHCPFVHTTEQAIASSRSGVAGDGGLEQAVPLSRSSHRTGRGWAPGVEPVSCCLLRWKEAQVALLFSVISSEPNLMPVAQGWT